MNVNKNEKRIINLIANPRKQLSLSSLNMVVYFYLFVCGKKKKVIRFKKGSNKNRRTISVRNFTEK